MRKRQAAAQNEAHCIREGGNVTAYLTAAWYLRAALAACSSATVLSCTAKKGGTRAQPECVVRRGGNNTLQTLELRGRTVNKQCRTERQGPYLHSAERARRDIGSGVAIGRRVRRAAREVVRPAAAGRAQETGEVGGSERRRRGKGERERGKEGDPGKTRDVIQGKTMSDTERCVVGRCDAERGS